MINRIIKLDFPEDQSKVTLTVSDGSSIELDVANLEAVLPKTSPSSFEAQQYRNLLLKTIEILREHNLPFDRIRKLFNSLPASPN